MTPEALLGGVLLLSDRTRCAGRAMQAAVVWSVVGLVAALPLVLTAVVLVLLPDEPVPTRRGSTPGG